MIKKISPQKIKGITLFETLLSIALILFMMAWFIPNWQNLAQNNQLELATNYLLKSITFARGLAIAQGENIMLCPSQNFKNCDGNWQNSYVVRSRKRIWQMAPKFHVKLIWKSSLAQNQNLTFSPSGLSSQQGSFYLCSANQSRRIVVNYSGNTTVVNSNSRC